MADSLRSHIADVLGQFCCSTSGSVQLDEPDPFHFDEADALLADPTLAALIDLASRHVDRYDTPEVWALLADWRAER